MANQLDPATRRPEGVSEQRQGRLDRAIMSGFAPVPQPLELTENTREFVRRVRTRVQEAGRHTPARRDWLLGLFAADPRDLSTQLLHTVGADVRTLEGVFAPPAHDAQVWFDQTVEQFTEGEVGAVAREIGHAYIGTEHVLLAFTRAPGPIGDRLRAAGLTWERVAAAFNAIEWGAAPTDSN